MHVEGLVKVGIAVRDLDKAHRRFTGILGLAPGRGAEFEGFRMRYETCYAGDVMIEFMESTSPEGPLARFIDSRGEGLQHISFRVSNLRSAIMELKEKGVEFVDETPIEIEECNLGRVRFVFARPESFNGVLVQLMELLEEKRA